jgi:hypothetical protein
MKRVLNFVGIAVCCREVIALVVTYLEFVSDLKADVCSPRLHRTVGFIADSEHFSVTTKLL